MAQCRYQGHYGLAVLTDARLIFLREGIFRRVLHELPLHKIDLVLWRSLFGFGTLTVLIAALPLQLTCIVGPGGAALLASLREQAAANHQLELSARSVLLSMVASEHLEPSRTAAVLGSRTGASVAVTSSRQSAIQSDPNGPLG